MLGFTYVVLFIRAARKNKNQSLPRSPWTMLTIQLTIRAFDIIGSAVTAGALNGVQSGMMTRKTRERRRNMTAVTVTVTARVELNEFRIGVSKFKSNGSMFWRLCEKIIYCWLIVMAIGIKLFWNAGKFELEIEL